MGILGAIVGLLVIAVIILVSGGDDDPATTTAAANPTVAASPSTSEPSVESTAAPTTQVPATATLTQFHGTTDEKGAAGDPFGTFNFLHDVRFQQREAGFTRVVFDFEEGNVPWWSVGYTAGPFIAISDEPIPVAGTEFLRVVLGSVGYDLSGAEVRITYNGPHRRLRRCLHVGHRCGRNDAVRGRHPHRSSPDLRRHRGLSELATGSL